ncbi:50S ribosomal protein L29 [Candidatus Phytoplasma melaleucae]|uniref:Large ribosomal subunit protein uL29 n=1 Tax=Candidatus Phytoplasma melaleucae TaxID=2982630 RepID=A0ABT9DDK8_9MOLU|nr:50S ribosomal protein L29 ['Melaleuca sp.' phytoplasma]MDO8168119.1 50S ribosomal protein L29 ['Melaleuca sp.' phytoplasma]MDV3205253.1 50S ribosomal protein L29 [Weeping tea tree witches'-broom phytoplasma]
MKAKEIRQMSNDDIHKQIIYLKKELFDNKLKLDLSKLKNTSNVRKIKKTIARLKTIMKENEIFDKNNSKFNKI